MGKDFLKRLIKILEKIHFKKKLMTPLNPLKDPSNLRTTALFPLLHQTNICSSDSSRGAVDMLCFTAAVKLEICLNVAYTFLDDSYTYICKCTAGRVS